MAHEGTDTRIRRYGLRGRVGWIAVALLAAVTAAGCNQPPPGAPGGGGGDNGAGGIPMTFTGSPNLSWLNVFVANDEGFFAKHGIEPNVKLFDVGFLGTEAVMAGEAQTAASVEYPFLNLIARDAKLVTPAVVVKANDQRIVVDNSIQRPQDLAGKRIGLIEGSAFEYAFSRYLTNFGVRPGSVEFVNVDAADQVATMARGDIDGFLNVEPVVSQALDALGEDEVHVLEPGIETVYTTRILLQMQRSFAEENPEAVRGTLQALIDAEQFIEQNPDRAVAIGAEWTQLPEEDVARFLEEANFDYQVHYDQDAFQAMNEVANWMADNDLFPSGKPDLNKPLHLEPLREVAPSAVEFKP